MLSLANGDREEYPLLPSLSSGDREEYPPMLALSNGDREEYPPHPSLSSGDREENPRSIISLKVIITNSRRMMESCEDEDQ